MTVFRCIAMAAVISIPIGSAGAHPGHDEPVEVPAWFATGEPVVTIEERDGFRHITANGVPDHATGAFPNRGNPHRISEQSYRFRVTLTPKPADRPVAIPRGVVGIAINGVVFDPGTAEAWRNDVNSGWNIEGINPRQGGLLGMDQNNAHVQPTGAYHYHGIPTGLVAQLRAKHGKDKMLLLGWAADGYPIYAPMAHEQADDPASKLRAMTSSYRIKQGARPGGNDGPGGRYDGTYTQDYEYIEGLGDLDACNGRTGVTPEYPDGTYYYVVTGTFPYIPRQLKGEPDASFRRGRGPGGPGGRGGPGERGPGGPDGQGGPRGGPGGRPPPR